MSISRNSIVISEIPKIHGKFYNQTERDNIQSQVDNVFETLNDLIVESFDSQNPIHTFLSDELANIIGLVHSELAKFKAKEEFVAKIVEIINSDKTKEEQIKLVKHLWCEGFSEIKNHILTASNDEDKKNKLITIINQYSDLYDYKIGKKTKKIILKKPKDHCAPKSFLKKINKNFNDLFNDLNVKIAYHNKQKLICEDFFQETRQKIVKKLTDVNTYINTYVENEPEMRPLINDYNNLHAKLDDEIEKFLAKSFLLSQLIEIIHFDKNKEEQEKIVNNLFKKSNSEITEYINKEIIGIEKDEELLNFSNKYPSIIKTKKITDPFEKAGKSISIKNVEKGSLSSLEVNITFPVSTPKNFLESIDEEIQEKIKFFTRKKRSLKKQKQKEEYKSVIKQAQKEIAKEKTLLQKSTNINFEDTPNKLKREEINEIRKVNSLKEETTSSTEETTSSSDISHGVYTRAKKSPSIKNNKKKKKKITLKALIAEPIVSYFRDYEQKFEAYKNRYKKSSSFNHKEELIINIKLLIEDLKKSNTVLAEKINEKEIQKINELKIQQEKEENQFNKLKSYAEQLNNVTPDSPELFNNIKSNLVFIESNKNKKESYKRYEESYLKEKQEKESIKNSITKILKENEYFNYYKLDPINNNYNENKKSYDQYVERTKKENEKKEHQAKIPPKLSFEEYKERIDLEVKFAKNNLKQDLYELLNCDINQDIDEVSKKIEQLKQYNEVLITLAQTQSGLSDQLSLIPSSNDINQIDELMSLKRKITLLLENIQTIERENNNLSGIIFAKMQTKMEDKKQNAILKLEEIKQELCQLTGCSLNKTFTEIYEKINLIKKFHSSVLEIQNDINLLPKEAQDQFGDIEQLNKLLHLKTQINALSINLKSIENKYKNLNNRVTRDAHQILELNKQKINEKETLVNAMISDAKENIKKELALTNLLIDSGENYQQTIEKVSTVLEKINTISDKAFKNELLQISLVSLNAILSEKNKILNILDWKLHLENEFEEKLNAKFDEKIVNVEKIYRAYLLGEENSSVGEDEVKDGKDLIIPPEQEEKKIPLSLEEEAKNNIKAIQREIMTQAWSFKGLGGNVVSCEFEVNGKKVEVENRIGDHMMKIMEVINENQYKEGELTNNSLRIENLARDIHKILNKRKAQLDEKKKSCFASFSLFKVNDEIDKFYNEQFKVFNEIVESYNNPQPRNGRNSPIYKA